MIWSAFTDVNIGKVSRSIKLMTMKVLFAVSLLYTSFKKKFPERYLPFRETLHLRPATRPKHFLVMYITVNPVGA